jgi:dTMP kinase
LDSFNCKAEKQRRNKVEKFLIAIEGSDGSGKETQSALLQEWFKNNGMKVATVSFPRYKQTAGGWALWEALKGENKDAYNFANVDPYAASQLYSADRRESLPYLQELISTNDVLIFDRYVESNLLHQGGKFFTEKEREDFARWLFNFEYGMLGLPTPQVTVYLELPFDITQKRALMRADAVGGQLDAVECDSSYVRNGYEAGIFYSRKFGWLSIPCVKEDGYELTRSEVHMLVVEKLTQRLELKLV